MPVQMAEVFQDSDNRTPMIFILTLGADPQNQILRFTQSIKGEDLEGHLHTISLGQGQKDHALKALEVAKENGSWVLLQNCHLYSSFMPTLEEEVLQIQENYENINPDF